MSDSKPETVKSDDAVLDLKGSEQHHDLKNQPGHDGDPDHAEDETSPEVEKTVKDALKDSDADGAVASAMKDSTE